MWNFIIIKTILVLAAVTVGKLVSGGSDMFEVKSSDYLSDEKLLRMLSLNNATLTRGMSVEEKAAPYIYRWSDGRRESGDKVVVTPWDDYDFNGSKDYEYQLTYKGCRITYIEARLLIPNRNGYCGYLDGGIQSTSVVLAIGAKAIDYFYYGVRIFTKC